MGRYASKRKSRNHRPVSIRKQIKKHRKPVTDDPKIIRNWDIKKSLNENYRLLGLSSGLHNDKNVQPSTEPRADTPSDPLITVPEDKGGVGTKLSEPQLEILGELQLVYGDDYKAMTRDIKRNPYQLTKKQLKKQFAVFHEKYEGTRFDPIFKPYNQELIKQQLESKEEQSDEESSE